MLIKVYVNTDCDACADYPRILTEKQFEEKLNSMVADKMKAENLAEDDEFDDFLGMEYKGVKLFFMKEEDKNRELNLYEKRVRVETYDYLLDIYEEHEIEI